MTFANNFTIVITKPTKGEKMSHKIVSTDKAPAAVGPYSQGCIGGGLLFISGQIPVNPATGEMVTDDIVSATRQSMENLLAVLRASGDGAHLVKVTIFLTDMSNFGAVNEVYASFFDSEPPARACIEVAALPKGAPIEIEGIAVLPE